MRSTLPSGERLLRGVVFALVGVALAVIAHWFGSGMVPGWPAMAISTGLLAGLGYWVGQRSRGMLLLVVLAVASQMGMHTAFAWSMGGRGVGVLLCGAPSAATAKQAALMFHAQVASPHGGSWSDSALPMLTAHLVAAILLGMWLRLGERVLDQAVATFGVVYRTWVALRTLIAALSVRAGYVRCTIRAERRGHRLSGRTVGAVGLRGPPVAVPFGV